jgi:hypothetical protein
MIKVFDFFLTGEIDWETKVDKGIFFLSDISRFFEVKDYGDDLSSVCIVIVCRSPDLIFKQRKRYSKKDKTFYLDIMLDYEEMVSCKDDLLRAKIIYAQIRSILFSKLAEYKFKNLDLLAFKTDFIAYGRRKKLL